MIAAAIIPPVAYAVLVSGLMQQASERPVSLSTPVLKQRLAEAQARLWAWEVEYESAREDRPGVPAKSYVHRIVAAKAPDRFFHWSAHGTPHLDWRDDPYQQRLTVTAERMFFERPLDRCFIEKRMRPDEPLPGTAPLELLLVALGWWPLAQRPPRLLVDKLPASLSAVAHSAAYEARSSLEHVGGRWCQVLESRGRDQLWLDVDRGCAVVAREINFSVPARVHRVEFADFREILAGVWVPFTLRNLIYEHAQDGVVGQTIIDATLAVRQVRLNEAVDDARFQFKVLPGSAAVIDDRPLRQAIAGGEEYLDEVVEWIRRYMPQADPPIAQIGWADWADVALGALLAAVVIIAILFGWRGWVTPQTQAASDPLLPEEKKEQ